MLRSPTKSGGIEKLIRKQSFAGSNLEDKLCMELEEIDPPMLFNKDIGQLCSSSQRVHVDNKEVGGSPNQRACVKEAEDEEIGGHPRWVEDYPGDAGEIKLKGQNYFECWREVQKENGYEPWVPFKDIEEWELAQQIMQSGLSQGATNKFLKLPIVSCIMI